MLRSIRWRLVSSYAALTLFTVLLVGMLALALIKQYAERQERDYLAANAEAVASQAAKLLQPAPRLLALNQLAHTAAFLGNVQVRILDPEGQDLADSGAPETHSQMVFLFPPRSGSSLGDMIPGGTFAMPLMPGRGGQLSGMGWGWTGKGGEIGGVTIITAQRAPSVWGDRLTFESAAEESPKQAPPPTPPVGGLLRLIYGDRSPDEASRSNQAVTISVQTSRGVLGYVELSNGPAFAYESLRTVTRAFVVAGIGVGLLAVIMGLGVSRSLTAPIQELGKAAAQMSGGDLSARAQVQGEDEIGDLARQFNHMAEGLQSSFAELAAERDALRRFIADASHELRTPITALKTFNELLQGAAANDPEAQAEFLAESAAQLERLEWITTNLLDLSRLDAHLVDLDLAQVEVADLLAAVVGPFKPIAQERGIDLTLTLPPAGTTLGCDQARMEIALRNLLDNGLKFTPPGGQVEIGADVIDDHIRLWVQDTGPGVREEDMPHIFDRFYRGQARSREGAQAPGSGLGLAIAYGVVSAHRGELGVENVPGAGARFTIDLPRLP